jgi:hypothetical protein
MLVIMKLLVFCIVLFLYLHVHYHVKTSNDLEMYEIEQPSKDKLEEVCDLRQPVMFNYTNEKLNEVCNRKALLDTYGAFDVKIRNLKDLPTEEEDLYIPISFTNGVSAIHEDTDKKYLIERNEDFLYETSVINVYKHNDLFIRPYMVANCMYDFMIASENVKTPFRYEVNYRNYFLVTEGEMTVKMSPPKNSKYLYEQTDYENFEFKSPVNPWDVQSEYRADFNKVKCLDVIVKKGFIIYIPPYWWYSFKFGKDTTILSFKYRTYMNNIALFPKLSMRILQSQNIRRKIAPLKT